MDWRGLSILLVGCAAPGSASAPAEPAAAASPVTATSTAPAANPKTPTSPSGAEPPVAAHGDKKEEGPPAAKPEQAHDEHHHEHGHGKAGYHMDFSEVERFARHFDGPERDAWQKPTEVVRFLELGAGQVIADIGAGTGYFLPHLSKAAGAAGRVLALDVEPNMVEYMKQRSQRGASPTSRHASSLPTIPGSCRAASITFSSSTPGITSTTARTTPRKLARALRPAGSLLIVDFTLESDRGRRKSTACRPSKS